MIPFLVVLLYFYRLSKIFNMDNQLLDWVEIQPLSKINKYTKEEDAIILQARSEGYGWTHIAKFKLNARTASSIKQRHNLLTRQTTNEEEEIAELQSKFPKVKLQKPTKPAIQDKPSFFSESHPPPNEETKEIHSTMSSNSAEEIALRSYLEAKKKFEETTNSLSLELERIKTKRESAFGEVMRMNDIISEAEKIKVESLAIVQEADVEIPILEQKLKQFRDYL